MMTDMTLPPATDEAAGSGDAAAENLARLKALFPQIVRDGAIDVEVLRQLVGEAVETGEERYGLNWKGKAASRAHALTPSQGTLRPAKADSVDWDTTQNIMIEGDNLEVLKLLRRSYAGKVKLIYIDPPYNTGRDFVYPDNFRSPLATYEALIGQKDRSGTITTSNRESAGRFHTDWLCMMYPRLMLAKELLAKDGVIVVSSDDAELDNLRHILRDVFHENGFAVQVIWKKRSTPPNDKRIGANHDYLTVFTVGGGDAGINLKERSSEQVERYQNPDNHPKGPWAAGDLMANVKGGRYVESLFYPIVNPKTGESHWPGNRGNWRFAKDKIEQLIASDEIFFGHSGDGKPKLKRFLCDVKEGVTYASIWDAVAFNTEGSMEMSTLFGEPTIFESPKPVNLIREVVRLGSSDEGVVLDFFAGSGTTAHAVMAQNAADGGKRKFILVQLPEPLDPEKTEQKVAADFCTKLGKPLNIAELTKERLRRAGTKLKAEHPDKDFDTGFRVYNLATSNLRPWQPDGDDLAGSLLDAVDNVLPGRSEDDLLVELMLKTGIDLTMPSETRTIADQTVHSFGGGALMVCLGTIADAKAEELALGIAAWRAELAPAGQTAFWFKDSGFASAAAKANVAAILRQRIAASDIARIAAL